MLQLYPILIVAIVLVADRVPALAARAHAIGGGPSAAIAIGPVILVLLVAAAVIWRCGRSLSKGQSARPIVVADRTIAVLRVVLLVNHAVAVLFADWLVTIRELTGNLVLVDEGLAILPPIAGAIGLWWLHYPLERRVREALLLRRLDQGKPIHRFPTRWRYVVQQCRLHLLLLLVPVLVILALLESIQLGFDQLPDGAVPTWAVDATTFAAGLGVFVFAPLLARFVLSVEPLAPGSVRDDLEEICRRHRIKVLEFLLWRTDGSMINAAVMGLIGPLRYVLLTDALIETMSRDQVQAVMAHEIGHVRRHHMPWLVVSLFAMLLLASFVVSAPLVAIDRLGVRWESGSAVWVDGIATAASAVLALLAFGWVSRRYERQADSFAVQHLSGLGAAEGDDGERPTVITAEAILAMHGALESVARLNSVDPNRKSWRHGSIAWRQAYLATTIGRPIDGLPIDRLIRRVKLGAAAILVAGGAATAALEWSVGRTTEAGAAAVVADHGAAAPGGGYGGAGSP